MGRELAKACASRNVDEESVSAAFEYYLKKASAEESGEEAGAAAEDDGSSDDGSADMSSLQKASRGLKTLVGKHMITRASLLQLWGEAYQFTVANLADVVQRACQMAQPGDQRWQAMLAQGCQRLMGLFLVESVGVSSMMELGNIAVRLADGDVTFMDKTKAADQQGQQYMNQALMMIMQQIMGSGGM
jgi:hypothetical protein